MVPDLIDGLCTAGKMSPTALFLKFDLHTLEKTIKHSLHV